MRIYQGKSEREGHAHDCSKTNTEQVKGVEPPGLVPITEEPGSCVGESHRTAEQEALDAMSRAIETETDRGSEEIFQDELISTETSQEQGAY